MNLSSALVALMISCVAGPALAAKAPNMHYEKGINAPSDMPLPTEAPPAPGYFWSCETDADGNWKKGLLPSHYACKHVFLGLKGPTKVVAQVQPMTTPDSIGGCVLDALYCTLPADLAPTDKVTGKQRTDFMKWSCNTAGTECTWKNLNVQDVSIKTCDPGMTLKSDGLCHRDGYESYPVRYGYGGYYYGGYGYQNASRGYSYHPSKLDAPSVCSPGGDFRRNGGRVNCN